MTRRLFGCLVLSMALVGCARTDLSGPPELRVGRDECIECGMLIAEDRCAAAMLVEEGGRHEHVMFDDLGCMLDYERDRGGRVSIVDRFARDHGTRTWVRAADAVFLFAEPEKLPTPMGSGMVAFSARADAERMQQGAGGRVLDYSGLAAARREWMHARYGRPPGEP